MYLPIKLYSHATTTCMCFLSPELRCDVVNSRDVTFGGPRITFIRNARLRTITSYSLEHYIYVLLVSDLRDGAVYPRCVASFTASYGATGRSNRCKRRNADVTITYIYHHIRDQYWSKLKLGFYFYVDAYMHKKRNKYYQGSLLTESPDII